jgi:hypothetical protein
VRDLVIERLECGHCGRAIRIEGLAAEPVCEARISDSGFRHMDAPNIVQPVRGLTLQHVMLPAPA